MCLTYDVSQILELILCLDVGKRRGSRVEGARVIELSCLDVF